MRVIDLINQLKRFDPEKGILLSTPDGEWKDPVVKEYDCEEEGMHIVMLS